MGFGFLEAPMIRLLVAMLLLAGLGACATPASYTSMVPELATADLGPGPAPSYRGAITVAPVSIGNDTSVPWTPPISSAEFQEALVRTLMVANLASAQNGRFRLEATLLKLERPYAGFAMTVTASIAYRLTETATGAVVYQDTRTSVGTASLNDAVTNVNRLRIANERAIRANFRKLIEDLYALPERGPLTSSRRT
ncbi:MAG: hypothetical protein QOJ17_659 [Rhodospirillaceae bacterium]|nr:hypothetical protein [Rhodospirillaceae bacterium]